MQFLSIFVSGLRDGRWVCAALALLLAGVLAGCQSSPAARGPSYLDGLQLAQVEVDFSRAERPLLVAGLDGEISRSVSGSDLGALGTRLGVINQQGRQTALEDAISANVKPHVRDALTPLMRGQRPVRAVVIVRSVFIRSRASLQQLTGAQVFINGQKRPDNAQFIASLALYDLATGAPINMVGPITRTDDGAITLAGGGPKAPGYGKARRLNQLAFEFAQGAANVLQREAAGQNAGIENDQGNVTTLWERRTTSTF
ncbi:hypothetical protein [uncultured Hoeflea sp.]|uniref:hypothetical protein n=1 Tax=uncultured Hoeflea sp. TaxID=538666 RepID=UPI00260B49B1|nr:hypothetical protein [uncultured Hoeflea sp.]